MIDDPRASRPEDDRPCGFTCNLCDSRNQVPMAQLGREIASCSSCGSTVRIRSLLRMLSLELFGTNLTVPAFPCVKSLRGLGISDIPQYAPLLAGKFDYRNTFYDHAPQFDIMNPPENEFGTYDFVISSEVFEHVSPPVQPAFSNAFRLLKPNGVLLLTIPYWLGDRSLEHFPDLYEYGTAHLGGATVLVNRTREGVLQIYENLVFHLGSGAALEMRVVNEKDLMMMLASAGFYEIHLHGENYEPYGVRHAENWSLPIAARRGTFALGKESAREILDELAGLRSEVAQLKAQLQAQESAKQDAARGPWWKPK